MHPLRQLNDPRYSEAKSNFASSSSVTNYAIFMLDPQGIVSNWNAVARRLTH
jgi:hypothetical protein